MPENDPVAAAQADTFCEACGDFAQSITRLAEDGPHRPEHPTAHVADWSEQGAALSSDLVQWRDRTAKALGLPHLVILRPAGSGQRALAVLVTADEQVALDHSNAELGRVLAAFDKLYDANGG